MRMMTHAQGRSPSPRRRILDWSSLRCHLLWIYDGAPQCRRGTFPLSAVISAWLIRRGNVEAQIKDQACAARSGQWMIAAPGTLTQRFSEDARILSLRFQAAWPTGESILAGRPLFVLDARRFPRLERAASALQRLVQRHFPGTNLSLQAQESDFRLFLRLQQLFAGWMLVFSEALVKSGQELRDVGRVDQRALNAAREIDRFPLHAPFSSADLASKAGVSPSQLDRLFVHEFNLTPRRYFERRRLQHARFCLASRTIPIKELAYQLGFRHAAHFSIWFHRWAGVSPRDFRRRPVPS